MTDFPRFDLTGQTALVTGAARGLGRSISLALANAGADVALGLRDAGGGSDLADEIRSLGRRALPVAMDVRRLYQIEAAVETARRLDRRTEQAVVARNAAALGDEDACGIFALRGLVELARRKNLSIALLDLRTSADTAGDPERVVGYGAFAV